MSDDQSAADVDWSMEPAPADNTPSNGGHSGHQPRRASTSDGDDEAIVRNGDVSRNGDVTPDDNSSSSVTSSPATPPATEAKSSEKFSLSRYHPKNVCCFVLSNC